MSNIVDDKTATTHAQVTDKKLVDSPTLREEALTAEELDNNSVLKENLTAIEKMPEFIQSTTGAHQLTGSEKSDFVKNLFGTISQTYDFTNDIITFGLARLWRKKLVQMSEAELGFDILDCATGTGDLAFEFKKVVGPNGSVTGVDFCKEMLDLAPNKSLQLNLPVTFELGDILDLNFSENKFDITSIAYGIRNVANLNLAISQMARVTKPGGKLMILETGEVKNPVLRYLIRFYFEKIVPRLGGWVSGNRAAYQYLQASSGAFPSGQEFCDQLMKTGWFSKVTYKSLMFGASYIYTATLGSRNESDFV